MKNSMLFLFIAFVFAACTEPESEANPTPAIVEGMKPIYVSENEAKTVAAQAPQSIKRLGKIYYKDAHIYVNESNLGVHVIDNTDPANPVNIKFLRIPGCRDIAIKGNILYADNAGDLVAVDISNLDNPVVTKRLEGIQKGVNQTFPELYEGYFECVESGKGVVVGWEKATLTEPKCRR